jgi:hypothetical protein
MMSTYNTWPTPPTRSTSSSTGQTPRHRDAGRARTTGRGLNALARGGRGHEHRISTARVSSSSCRSRVSSRLRSANVIMRPRCPPAWIEAIVLATGIVRIHVRRCACGFAHKQAPGGSGAVVVFRGRVALGPLALLVEPEHAHRLRSRVQAAGPTGLSAPAAETRSPPLVPRVISSEPQRLARSKAAVRRRARVMLQLVQRERLDQHLADARSRSGKRACPLPAVPSGVCRLGQPGGLLPPPREMRVSRRRVANGGPSSAA